MTVEEIEIIVTAKVEEALKEVKKIVPAITKAVQQAQESFQKVNAKAVTNKVNQTIQFVKKKIESLKKSNQNNEIKINVNNKEASKQISQLEKQINSLQEKINARQMKLNMITPRLDQITEQATREVTPEGVNSDNPAIQKTINNSLASNKEYNTLLNQESKMTQEISMYNKQLDIAKTKMAQLKQQTEQTTTTQNKLNGFFKDFKGKVEQVKSVVNNMKSTFKQMPNITKNITNNIKKMGTGLKSGLGHVLKYAGALLSLRGIYSVLSNSAQGWLSSQNKGAQQLSANIEYMKYAMGSAFAPVIQYVINLVYQLMKAIQSVVYAFSGVNIFAKATASSMGKTAKSAKETNKSLAGVHNEINNVSEKDNSSGGGSVSPSMDLSKLDAQMNPFAQKLHDFFKPLVDSWNTYGAGLIEQVKVTASQIGGLIASVWGSFENIITNGTVYSILQNILAIIGNIAEAFSNAWNYNGNGDAIVQSLANAFNNLLNAINNVVKSEGFQNFLKWCSDKFREIAEKIESIDWQPLMDALSTIGEVVGIVALEILNGLVDIFKWLVENPIVAEILLAIAVAIGIVSTAITIWSTVQGILNAILLASPITWIIVAITALIAIIILCILHWEEIKTVVANVWETIKNAVLQAIEPIKQYLSELWQKVSEVFQATWEIISTILGFIWNLIATVFQAIWNIVSPIINAIWQIISTIFQAIWNVVSTVLGSVWNVFSQIFNWIWELTSRIFQGIWNVISPIMNAIWTGIKTALSWIQQIWSNVWNGIATIVSNVWNGIWSCIKGVINAILGGIENMVNGVIKGVNWILSGVSSIANAIGGLVGMKPINLKLNYVALPRLAKGNVAYSPLIAQFGEYAGASHNPEITTPQNIMAETFEDVLSNHEWKNSSNSDGEIKQVVFQFGSYRVAMEIESLLRQARRQNGTATVTV